jgi:hypothetical protein
LPRSDDLDDLIGRDCVLEITAPAPDGARFEGRNSCLEFWKGVASSKHLDFTAEEIWTSGDCGIIRAHLRGGKNDTDWVRCVNIFRVGAVGRSSRGSVTSRLRRPLPSAFGAVSAENVEIRA